MWSYRFLLLSLLLPATVGAQEKPAEPPMHMEHQHHGGFMQEGMHHAIAKGVTLDAKVDAGAHTATLRVGPMNLPARTDHMKMPQPPDQVWQVPFDGWLLAYHPKLVDAAGGEVPGTVLHHTAFWNENRSDFLCPNKEEHIFGAGSELTDWSEVPGYGYHVQKDDRIRIETMGLQPHRHFLRKSLSASRHSLPGLRGKRAAAQERLSCVDGREVLREFQL